MCSCFSSGVSSLTIILVGSTLRLTNRSPVLDLLRILSRYNLKKPLLNSSSFWFTANDTSTALTILREPSTCSLVITSEPYAPRLVCANVQQTNPYCCDSLRISSNSLPPASD